MPRREAETVIADIELSWVTVIQLTVVGILGLWVALGLLNAAFEAGTSQRAMLGIARVEESWWGIVGTWLLLVVLGTSVIVPHEWLHGLAIRYFGGRPRYGVGLAYVVFPYAYATTDYRFTRNQFLVVLLTPLVVVSIVGVPVMILLEWSWLIIPIAVNAGGAVADVWMSLLLLGYPSHVNVEDRRNSVHITGDERDRPRGLSVPTVIWHTLVGAGSVSIGVVLILLLGGPFVVRLLGGEATAIGRSVTATLLSSFVVGSEYRLTVTGFGVPVAGAVLGFVYSVTRAVFQREDARRVP